MIRLGNYSPKFSSVPSISGTAGVGNVLTVSAPGDSLTYQWYRDGVAINGETSVTYTLVTADRGAEIKCFVTSTDGGGKTAGVWSQAFEFYIDINVSEVDTDAIAAAELLELTLTTRSRIYFKAGETYEVGDLTLPYKSTVSSYGEGADPILIGSIDISTNTWTDEGSDTWSITMDEPNWVFVDGIQAKRAMSAWLSVSSLPATNIVRGNKTIINAFTNSIVGAKLRMYLFEWIFSDEFTVTAYDSATGNITLDQDHGAGQSIYFYLYGQQQHLTDEGEWFYNTSEGKLYYKSTVDPSTLNIRATYYDYGLIIGGHNVTVENVTIKQYHHAGIYNPTGLYLTGSNFAISDIHNHGIFSPLPCTFSDFTIERCGNQGMTVYDAYISDFTIDSAGVALNWPEPESSIHGGRGTSNGNGIYYRKSFPWTNLRTYIKFELCYYQGKYYQSKDLGNLANTPSAVSAYWTEIGDYSEDLIPVDEISYGEISNTAYCSINVHSCKGLGIYKNVLHDFLKRTRDGGAIYLISQHPVRTKRLWTSRGNIHHNIIYNGTKTAEQNLVNSARCNGIYIDNYALYFTVEDNTIITNNGYRIEFGIVAYVPTKSSTIRRNHIIGSDEAIYIYEHQAYSSFPNESGLQSFYPQNISNIVTDNVLACKRDTYRCLSTRSVDNSTTYNPFISGGDCDNNYYIQPYGTDINSHEASTVVDYTLSEWRTRNGLDAGSSELTNYLTFVSLPTSDAQVLCSYNATDEAATVELGDGYIDKDGNVITEAILQPYESVVYTLAE